MVNRLLPVRCPCPCRCQTKPKYFIKRASDRQPWWKSTNFANICISHIIRAIQSHKTDKLCHISNKAAAITTSEAKNPKGLITLKKFVSQRKNSSSFVENLNLQTLQPTLSKQPGNYFCENVWLLSYRCSTKTRNSLFEMSYIVKCYRERKTCQKYHKKFKHTVPP